CCYYIYIVCDYCIKSVQNEIIPESNISKLNKNTKSFCVFICKN
ncbi:hypothetical protein CP02DC14_1731, partial [Chlamydia psittaci 02DC14]